MLLVEVWEYMNACVQFTTLARSLKLLKYCSLTNKPSSFRNLYSEFSSTSSKQFDFLYFQAQRVNFTKPTLGIQQYTPRITTITVKHFIQSFGAYWTDHQEN